MPPLIGEGNYGCVYRPPLPCLSTPSAPPTPHTNSIYHVGKVFASQKDFMREKRIMKVLQRIDPKNTFTLPIINTCTISTTTFNNSSTKPCESIQESVIERNKPILPQLTMPYGGINLKSYMRKHRGNIKSLKTILQASRSLLQGLALMARKGYVHQDIKPQNILVGENDKRLILIDFGIMVNHRRVFDKSKNDYVLEFDYPYYPPEFKLFSHKTTSLASFLPIFKDNFSYRTISKRGYLDIIENDLNIDIKKQLKELISHPSYDVTKIDIYSLGIVFLELYMWCGFADAKSPKRSTQKQIIKSEFSLLISHMIHLDPTQRCTCEAALTHLDKLLTLF